MVPSSGVAWATSPRLSPVKLGDATARTGNEAQASADSKKIVRSMAAKTLSERVRRHAALLIAGNAFFASKPFTQIMVPT
jgi:hypothetical protein